MNFSCPICPGELQRTDSGFGVVWVCAGCKGRAVTVSLLRKGVEKGFMNELWQEARQQQQNRGLGYRKCPSCRAKMVTVTVGAAEKSLVLDVCATCQFIWFDEKETEALPMLPVQKSGEPELTPEAKEVLARVKVAQIAADARREESLSLPTGWSAGPAVAELLWRIFHD